VTWERAANIFIRVTTEFFNAIDCWWFPAPALVAPYQAWRVVSVVSDASKFESLFERALQWKASGSSSPSCERSQTTCVCTCLPLLSVWHSERFLKKVNAISSSSWIKLSKGFATRVSRDLTVSVLNPAIVSWNYPSLNERGKNDGHSFSFSTTAALSRNTV
jgi:hypothetical protein